MRAERRATPKRMREILARLRRTYGRRRRRRDGTGVDTLVGTILSQNTSGANSSAGFRRLKERFASWDAAADAPVREIERCIRVSGLGRLKAPRIRRILRAIREERGRISIEFLRRRAPDKAYDYLRQFPGVGPKTALCVLLFSFGMPVFPVDTHIHRIARRLGLVGPSVTAGRAHEALTPRIAPDDRYEMHVLLIAHGRQTCRAQRPRCGECHLLSLCPHGQRVAATSQEPAGR